jgi:hypothetical protein
MDMNWRFPALIASAALLGAAYLWWTPPGGPLRQSIAIPDRSPDPTVPYSVPESPKPVVQPEAPVPHVLQPTPETRPIAAPDIGDALADLLGRKGALSFLQLDNFLVRVVATVDNLGRSHAPSMMWPVTPTAGRFMVDEHAQSLVINPDNGQRYTALVLVAEALDVGRVVALYLRIYPLLQQTYVDLGFPAAYFNDRVIEVIDLLLATPDAPERVQLKFVEVKGSVPSLRPWVRYEFADEALESLSSGQKIMLRVGAVNERRLKARLVAIRAEIMRHSVPR